MSDATRDMLFDMHARRVDRVEDAWCAAVVASEEQHVAAWRRLGWLGDDAIDAAEFCRLVEGDTARSGAPSTCTDFCAHYNRMLAERAGLFSSLYTLGRKLGEGGFGAVVCGSRGKQTYAMKMVQKRALKPKTVRNLEVEMEIWQVVRHPSCCACYGVYELADAFVMVSELCNGGCLLDIIMELDQFSEVHACYISRQVADAVVHLHTLGIAHRDIKPENVLCIDASPHLPGHVKLADFGCAAYFNAADGGEGSFQQLIGTPEYLAPEMVQAFLYRRKGESSEPYSYKVDYWALGCLVYELLAGEPPFLSDDDEEQYQLTLNAPLTFSAEHNFGVAGSQAQQLVAALLERDPEKRLGPKVCDHPFLQIHDDSPADSDIEADAPTAADGLSARTPRVMAPRTSWRVAGHALMLAGTPLNRRAAAAKTRTIRLNRYKKAIALERSVGALADVSYRPAMVSSGVSYGRYSQMLTEDSSLRSEESLIEASCA